MERRTELLRAALRVYARHGYRGSTTRRIADEAGVNEVTIFRQFGTKDALILEAITTGGGQPPMAELPAVPADPWRELREWASAMRTQILGIRDMLHRCLSERDEHPQLICAANAPTNRAHKDLHRYLATLHAHRFVPEQFDTKAAAAMLMGAVFADVMGREAMPEMYSETPARAVEQYAALLLRAVGAEEQPAARARASRAAQPGQRPRASSERPLRSLPGSAE